jgi:hypothetical protein
VKGERCNELAVEKARYGLRADEDVFWLLGFICGLSLGWVIGLSMRANNDDKPIQKGKQAVLEGGSLFSHEQADVRGMLVLGQLLKFDPCGSQFASPAAAEVGQDVAHGGADFRQAGAKGFLAVEGVRLKPSADDVDGTDESAYALPLVAIANREDGDDDRNDRDGGAEPFHVRSEAAGGVAVNPQTSGVGA